MRSILWFGALLGACDVIQDGGHIGRILGFYQKLEIMKNRWKLEIVDPSHVKYDIVKHFAAFCVQFVLFSPKKAKTHSFTQKWLDHLLLMTSYLVTIATDSHHTCVKMCRQVLIKNRLEKFKKNLMGGGIHPPPSTPEG